MIYLPKIKLYEEDAPTISLLSGADADWIIWKNLSLYISKIDDMDN